MPGDTAFTRMLRAAYSIARLRVAAAKPPLVNDARTEGTLEFAWSTSVVVICTMWPPPCLSIASTAGCVV
ncbi:hypothetical protein D3C87_2178100 [compost metagenome]